LLWISVGAEILGGFQIEADKLCGDEELFEDRGIFSKLIEDEKLSYELKSPEVLQIEAFFERTLGIIVKKRCVHYKL
jgi:hypothetical protein